MCFSSPDSCLIAIPSGAQEAPLRLGTRGSLKDALRKVGKQEIKVIKRRQEGELEATKRWNVNR